MSDEEQSCEDNEVEEASQEKDDDLDDSQYGEGCWCEANEHEEEVERADQ